jgi:hypothetical protein
VEQPRLLKAKMLLRRPRRPATPAFEGSFTLCARF